MPDDTDILGLPLILPNQAQKHVTHNEALLALDVLVQLAVISRNQTVPPALATVGDRHIVPTGATQAWAGQAGKVAVLSETGWQFHAPNPGWQAYVLADKEVAVFDGVAWVAASDSTAKFARLGVSANPDATNRLAVSSPATLLNHAGAGHQLKLNKAAAADTASLLFQTGFSGRAEMGIAGSDAFSVKVSADGSAWNTALTAAAATGEVSFPKPVTLGGQAADPASPANGTLWLNTTSGQVKLRSAGATVVVGVADGDKGDITVTGSGATWTIDPATVTNAKLANMATGRLKGRVAAGTGSPQDLTSAEATGMLDVFTSAAKGLAPASGGGTLNFLRADGSWAVPPLPPVLGPHDFWQDARFGSSTATSPDHFAGVAINTGTNTTALPAGAGLGLEPSGVFLRTSTTANSGYRYVTSTVQSDYFGVLSHRFRAILQWKTDFTGKLVRLGFLDTTTSTDATDGAYFQITAESCVAKTSANNTRTTHATTLTLALDTIYTFDIEVNAAGTDSRFRVYSGQNPTALMDVPITTNLPTDASRAFGCGMVATSSATTASDLVILHMMGTGTIAGYQRATGDLT